MVARRWPKPSVEDLQRLSKHLPDEDGLDLIILKGHLIVEEHLERIIRHVVAHGDLLSEARLTFNHKVVLARAMCWSQHQDSRWALIFVLNSLRNDLVHQLEPPKFDSKLKAFLAAHLAEYVETPSFQNMVPTWSTAAQLRTALALLMGFLGNYEKEAIAHRALVDDWLAKANPPQ